MVEMLITEIKQGMLACLDNAQMERLDHVLKHCFFDIAIEAKGNSRILDDKDNDEILNTYIAAKHVEGCAKRTMYY